MCALEDQNKSYKAKYAALFISNNKTFAKMSQMTDELNTLKAQLTPRVDSSSVINSADMDFLLNIPIDRKSDFSFAQKLLTSLYENHETVLHYRSAYGTPGGFRKLKNGEIVKYEAKEKVTPEKMAIFRSMFKDRFSKRADKPANFNAYLTELIGRAITCIRVRAPL